MYSQLGYIIFGLFFGCIIFTLLCLVQMVGGGIAVAVSALY